MITKELIGKKIQQARLRKHITQEELAEAVELSPNYLSKVERGLNMLNSVKFLKIVDYLNIDLIEFGISNQKKSENKYKKLNTILLNSNEDDIELITALIKAVIDYKK